MNFKSALIDRVYIVRWIGIATISDFGLQLQEMERGAARVKQKLIHIAIVPEGTPSIPADVRGEIVRKVPQVLEHCDAVYNVIEGSGFWAGTMRSMIAGMLLASKLTRGKSQVCQTFDEAVEKIADEFGVDRAALVRRARLEGMIP